MRFRFLLFLALLALFGVGCARRTSPAPQASSAPEAPARPTLSPSLQEKFPDHLDEGLKDLELLEDIK